PSSAGTTLAALRGYPEFLGQSQRGENCMRKIFRYALTGFVVASFRQFAFAQSVGVNPKTGDTTVSPNVSPNVQANPQIGQGNQSGQTIGKDNQTSNTQQSGAPNQNSTQQGENTAKQGQTSGSAATGASGDKDTSGDKNPNAKG